MTSPQPAPRKWAVFAAVGLSYFLTVMTMTLSLLALRAIADDFDVTLRTVGWVVIVESLIVAALLLPFGGLADVMGRHRTLRAGVALFGIGLGLTGLAPSFALLIVARIVTALGNTLVQSVGTGILVAAFPPAERGLALGAQTTAVAIGAAVGPLLGGFLLDELDWQVLFLVLAVPAAITLGVVQRVLGPERDRARVRSRTFDVTGAVLAAAFIVALVFTVNDPAGFALASPAAAAGVTLVLLVAFVRAELRHPEPMLDLRLFSIGEFRRAVAIRVVAFIASTTIMFLIPIYLLGVRDVTTREAGGILAVFAVGMTLGRRCRDGSTIASALGYPW